jgi:hypothetical protein
MKRGCNRITWNESHLGISGVADSSFVIYMPFLRGLCTTFQKECDLGDGYTGATETRQRRSSRVPSRELNGPDSRARRRLMWL